MEQEIIDAQQDTPQVSEMSREQLDTILNAEPVEESEINIEPDKDENDGDKKNEEDAGKLAATAMSAVNAGGNEETLNILKTELDGYKKKTEHQDKLINRMGTDIGLLRKKTPEEEQAELERIRNVYLEDPVAGHEEYEKFRLKKAEEEKEQRLQDTYRRAEETRTAVNAAIPDFETVLDDIVGLLSEDNVSPETIKYFKSTPYAYSAETLFNLYKRNELAKQNAALKNEIETLKKEQEELKKRPDKILRNIEDAARTQTITARSAGAHVNSNEDIPNKPVSRMTREELNKILGGK